MSYRSLRQEFTVFRPRAAATAAVAALAAVQLVGAGSASAAPTLPFSDDAAKGYVGFCDGAGKQITSGSTATHPFVTRAVSSVAAPAEYRAKVGGKATVYVFQPRRDTEPSEWAGRQVTAASFYDNSAHPMAAGTELDYSLNDFLSVYPARWNGLLQVRVFLSAPNRPVLLRPYAAAVIKISGSRWTVVGGGSVDCTAGRARSSELTNLSPEQFQAQLRSVRKQRAVQQASAPASNRPVGSDKNTTGTGNAGTTSGSARNPDGQGAEAAQTSERHGSGGISAVVWVVLVLAALVLAAGAAALWTRRRPPAEG